MRIAVWDDYELIDTSGGERLERWGSHHLIRPDPQIIWQTERKHPLWRGADAHYLRSNTGGGHWEYNKNLPVAWTIEREGLKFSVSPTGFKHTGLFPEQAVNWDIMAKLIKQASRPISVLNLFAYTGGATLACAKAGACVCHVDAAKGMVQKAKENAVLSGLSDKPIRYIVDDCRKFLEREIRRGVRYDGVVLDPPSYGRGPGGEVWKLEDEVFGLMQLVRQVLSEKPLFVLLNSYTTGLSCSVMEYLLGVILTDKFNSISSDEIGLLVTETGLSLPSGTTAYAING